MDGGKVVIVACNHEGKNAIQLSTIHCLSVGPQSGARFVSGRRSVSSPLQRRASNGRLEMLPIGNKLKMAKRFTETTKWNDPWFRTLPPRSKLLWFWLVDHCDCSGVLEPDWGLVSFHVGEEVTSRDLKPLGDRVEMRGGKIFIPKFVSFQFGRLSADSKPHQGVFKLLRKNGIDVQEVQSMD